MNKLVFLGVLILELNERLLYEFWYDYVTPKYGEKAKIVLYGCIHLYTYVSLYT